MKIFYIKVKTYKNYGTPENFSAQLEDLIPCFYNPKTEEAEESKFDDIKVISTREIAPLDK